MQLPDNFSVEFQRAYDANGKPIGWQATAPGIVAGTGHKPREALHDLIAQYKRLMKRTHRQERKNAKAARTNGTHALS